MLKMVGFRNFAGGVPTIVDAFAMDSPSADLELMEISTEKVRHSFEPS